MPSALGDKIIHPFSDFLLHDVGTGDGIVQNGGPLTRNKLRTAPLWGLRTRTRLMHDGVSLTLSGSMKGLSRKSSPKSAAGSVIGSLQLATQFPLNTPEAAQR